MAASQPPTCHLLRMPRELRDEIYTHYFAGDDGYHHHPDTNTLRYLDGTVIDVALLYTCKQVAAEATEFTFSKNTIKFKTRIAVITGVEGVIGSSLQSTVSHYSGVLRRLGQQKIGAFRIAIDAYGAEELTEYISKQYPQSGIRAQLQLWVHMKKRHCDLPDTAVGTIHVVSYADRLALRDALEYICSHFGLPQWLRSWNLIRWPYYIKSWICPTRHVRRTAFEIASSTFSSTQWPHWVTPTAVQIKEASDLLAFLSNGSHGAENLDGGKALRYYESAASQSIRFLGRLTHLQRSQLRHLDIREDRKCSSLPRCHAHGLIPYLKDLPRLRVVHRVDMWSAIFLNSHAMLGWINASRIPWLQGRPTCPLIRAAFKIIDWIIEAMDLRYAGMPPSAYALHLEANVKTAQRVWNAIKSLAALSLAYKRQYHQTDGPPSLRTMYPSWDYYLNFEKRLEWRLVTSVRLILSGDSTVRLSCPIGSLKEFEEEAYRIGTELKDQPKYTWKGYARSLVQGNLDTEDYDFTPLHELYHDPFLE